MNLDRLRVRTDIENLSGNRAVRRFRQQQQRPRCVMHMNERAPLVAAAADQDAPLAHGRRHHMVNGKVEPHAPGIAEEGAHPGNNRGKCGGSHGQKRCLRFQLASRKNGNRVGWAFLVQNFKYAMAVDSAGGGENKAFHSRLNRLAGQLAGAFYIDIMRHFRVEIAGRVA